MTLFISYLDIIDSFESLVIVVLFFVAAAATMFPSFLLTSMTMGWLASFIVIKCLQDVLLTRGDQRGS